MSIDKFMKTNLVIIKDEIIKNIPNENFDSHEFIKHFAKKFEVEYIEHLNSYKSEPFRKIHAQIGKFLSVNQNMLGIMEKGITHSANIFGVESQNEKWSKLK